MQETTEKELMVETKDFKVLVSMLMSLGCECTVKKAQDMYEAVTGKRGTVGMNVREFALIVQKYVDEECDPVEGLIEAVAERYDKGASGMCKNSEIKEFMVENSWLEAEQEAVEKVLSEFRDDKG